MSVFVGFHTYIETGFLKLKKLSSNTGLSSAALVKKVCFGALVAILSLNSVAVSSAEKSASAKIESSTKKKKYRAVAKERAMENSHIIAIKSEYVQAEADSIIVELEGAKRARKAQRKAVKRIARELARANGFNVERVFAKTVKGFSASLDEEQISALLLDERVEFVQQDEKIELFGTRANPGWNLDAIDNPFAEFDGLYTYDYTGRGVTVYVVDQGVTNQSGFFNPDLLEEGKNIVPWGTTAGEDAYCESHGTKVAGVIANETYGVAPGVTLVPVRVATCDDVSAAGILSGLEWILEDAESRGPTVVNMSLGGKSEIYLGAVQALIDAGTTVVTSAGNHNQNACDWIPAKVPDVITVGASIDTFTRADYSNWGSCVDLFAPAEVLTVNRWEEDTFFGGTSASSPHVAGAVALYLEANPNATPVEVSNALTGNATTGVITDLKDSPNLFLNTSFISESSMSFPGKVQAESYSSNVGIRLENTNDNGADQSLAYVNNNDSVTYNVVVQETGFYTIDFRVTSTFANNVINLSSGGESVGSVVVPSTGGWHDWKTVSTEVFLVEGAQNFKLTFNGSSSYLFNLNWFDVKLTPESGVLRLPGKIEAEDYTSESGTRVENTNDASGKSVAYIQDSDSVTYLVDVSDSGTYTFTARVASPYSGNMINILSDGKLVGTTEVNSTGHWQSWDTTISTELDLDSGMQEITLEFKGDTGYLFNVNWFEVLPVR